MHSTQESRPPGLDLLVAFETVARELSFVRAGRALGIDASVVARRIAALETALGVRLVARTTRRMTLTESGQAYLARIAPALEELARAAAEAGDRSDRPAGTLRVSLPLGFGQRWVTPLLAPFLASNPGVSLDVRYTDRFVDLVDERFDLALRLGTLAESGLVARRIRDYERGLYASPRYLRRAGTPASPASLATHRALGFAGFERPSQWTLSNGRRRVVTSVPLALVSDDAATLVAAACADVGITIGADWLVHDAVAAGRLVRVLPAWTVGRPGAAYVVVPTMRFLPAKTRAFADWLVESLRALPPSGMRPRRRIR